MAPRNRALYEYGITAVPSGAIGNDNPYRPEGALLPPVGCVHFSLRPLGSISTRTGVSGFSVFPQQNRYFPNKIGQIDHLQIDHLQIYRLRIYHLQTDHLQIEHLHIENQPIHHLQIYHPQMYLLQINVQIDHLPTYHLQIDHLQILRRR